MNEEELGRTAYDAYCAKRDWKSFNGDPLPHWNQQDEGLKSAWIESAKAVAKAIALVTGRG
jgi:hypothetical protein